MADEQVELEERIVVKGGEGAQKVLEGVAGAAGKVAHAFEGIGEIAGVLGGIGGVFAFAEGLRDASELYGAVGRISRATGVAAANAHGMFEAFERSGIGIDQAELVMTSMARMAGKISDSVSESGKAASELSARMRAVGVNTKSGLTDQMLQMAEAAKKGKLSLQDITTVFGIPRRDAERMLLMLRKGPEAMRDIFEEVKSSSGVIDERALASFGAMKKARLELKTAWQEIANTLFKDLVPIATMVLKDIKGGFDKVRPVVDAIGASLAGHMRTVVHLTEVWLALTAANKLAGRFGMGSMPLLFAEEGGKSRIGQLAAGARGLFGKAGLLGGAAEGAAGAAGAAAGVAEGGAVAGGLSGLVGSVGSVVGALGPLAVVAAAIYGAFEILKHNTFGIATWLKEVFGNLIDHLKEAFTRVVAILGALWAAIEPVTKIIGGVLLIAVGALGTALDWLIQAFNWVADAIIGIFNAVIGLINHLPGVNISTINTSAERSAKEAAEGAKNPAPEGKSAQTYQDFRGSKFDIANNFPQGVDGNRIAVSFGDELARLGERRIDSGLRPLYSYR